MQARRSVALVGDSYASCPLSKALRALPEPNRSHCARWKRAVFEWFERHPEVDTNWRADPAAHRTARAVVALVVA